MRYFIYADNRQQGPFSVAELMERGLASETLVWAEGMEQWTPAWQVKELKDAIEGKAQPGPVPPPLPPEQPASPEGAASQADEANAATEAHAYAKAEADPGTHGAAAGRADDVEEIIYEPRRRRISGRVTGIVAAVVIAFALTVTCPTREQHCEAVAGEISSAISQSSGAGGFWGMFGNIFASGVVNMAVSQFLEVDNYFLFSIGTINIEGKSNAVSFGILNHVFTFDNNYIQQAINEERMAD